MKKPILVVMAAGMGSRYGGLKQIAPVDDYGHVLMDYSLYDARRAGFETVVVVITPKLKDDFHEVLGRRIERYMRLRYAYQTLDILPGGYSVPPGRTKPWGTAHAVLSAKAYVDVNFAVINADDYYGVSGYGSIYEFLLNTADAQHHAMVGYRLENTITEHGRVARGICMSAGDRLVEVIERTHVEQRPGGAVYIEGGREHFMPNDTITSMNFWGFGLPMMDEIENRFAAVLDEKLPGDPLGCEYFLPSVPNQLLAEGKASVRVLPTHDRWYGVTYTADMPLLRERLAGMRAEGVYPERLWDEH